MAVIQDSITGLRCLMFVIQAANNTGADQTVRMHRLICAFAVLI